MTETVQFSVDQNQLGCGFMNVIFRNRYSGKKKLLTKSLLPSKTNNCNSFQSTVNKSANKPLPRIDKKQSANPVSDSRKCNLKRSRERVSDFTISSTSSSSNRSGLRKESLNRVSSGNIITSSVRSVKPTGLDNAVGSKSNIGGGHILRKNRGEVSKLGNIYRSLTVLDPEVVKNMGNEKYKEGKFSEALSMYNQAISLDPKRAVYYSNKGAALIGLGRLIEAVFECMEAIRIEPSYHRAHHRLATLYFRLGEAEKAQHHYQLSELRPATDEIIRSRDLKRHLSACKRAMKLKNWNALLNESQHAMSLGADSAPQIIAMKIEALLNILKPKEAYEALDKGSQFDSDSYCRLFGRTRTAYILTIHAHIYTLVGRFDEALGATHQAIQLDKSCNTNAIYKKVKAVTLARSKGNNLFYASKIAEAIVTYNEGLQLDPYNSVLLCNRAACEFKLGQFEKAVEDCTKALNVRPCYSKARLRRANCYTKLEKWKAAIEDYEVLVRDTPEDEELGKYLMEARARTNMQHFEGTIDTKTRNTVRGARY